jgi:hypothetical protein
MYIRKKQIKLISDIMDELPNARSFRLVEEGDSGIGSILKLIVESELLGKPVEVTFEISGVEDW